MMDTFVLPTRRRSEAISRVGLFLGTLPSDRPYRIDIQEHKPKRSLSQNALLWSIYDDIIKRGGEAMAGWEASELHDFFLMEHYGSETVEIFGKRKLRPLRRSSKLTKMEFSDHVEFVLRFMAQRGVGINMPGDL